MTPISFIIDGSGWRSLFFVRIAKRYPEQFNLKYMLCRSPEKAERMAAEHGIPTTTSIEDCINSAPDFAVVAVSGGVLAEKTELWTRKGIPVLCETPAGNNYENLCKMYELVKQGGKIQIAEQYHRYPVLSDGLNAIENGLLGDVNSVYLSLAHDYHGISMIRRMLGAGAGKKIKLISLRGEKFYLPVTKTMDRNGPIITGEVIEVPRITVRFIFEVSKPDDTSFTPYQAIAFYDFSLVAYHTYIRTRHINVQGQRGEWNDTVVRYIDENHMPHELPLNGYFAPKYAPLMTDELTNENGTWLPAINMSDSQDEYAIATMMLDMREYILTGKEVYPMAEALEDSYLMLLIREAMSKPNTEIYPQPMPFREI